jgi:hypothetical protein
LSHCQEKEVVVRPCVNDEVFEIKLIAIIYKGSMNISISQEFLKGKFIILLMTSWEEAKVKSVLQMKTFSRQQSNCNSRKEIFSSKIFY